MPTAKANAANAANAGEPAGATAARRPSDRTIALGELAQRTMSRLAADLREGAGLLRKLETPPSRAVVRWLRSKTQKPLTGEAAALEASLVELQGVVEDWFYWGDRGNDARFV
jgi:hypothetical protein